MLLLNQNLQAFLSVYDVGTVHGAAKNMSLTQTAVTQRIRSLEKQLSLSLFTRSRKGMKLTSEGEALLQYCHGAEELEGVFMSRVQNAGQNNNVSITIIGPTSIVTGRIANACLPLYSEWPHLNINFVVDDHSNRAELVKNGSAHFAIISPSEVPNEMDSKRLKPDRFILVGCPKWRGRRLLEIVAEERIIDFYQHDSTTMEYLRHFKLSDGVVRPRLFVNNNEVLIRLVTSGAGFATLTSEVAKPFIEEGALIQLNGATTLEVPQALIWYPRRMMAPYFKAVLQAISNKEAIRRVKS